MKATGGVSGSTPSDPRAAGMAGDTPAKLQRDGIFAGGLSPSALMRQLMPFAVPGGEGKPFSLARRPNRRLPGLGTADPFARTLGRIGDLEVRLARSPAEIRKAQAIRYEVFYREMSAIADAMTLATGRDSDAFDRVCDHMLVLDHGAESAARGFRKLKPEIVGTYRLLHQRAAARSGGFYSSGEFDLSPMLERHAHRSFLELGRSCVLPPYRSKRTIELLWHGIWSYVLNHGVDVMIGCASLEGTDPDRLALPLSFLHHYAPAPAEWRAEALPSRRVPMNLMRKEAVDARAALQALPPLLKGYLRLGAVIGDGAVIDDQFGTTDVLIVMPVERLNPRYVTYYGQDAGRHAA